MNKELLYKFIDRGRQECDEGLSGKQFKKGVTEVLNSLEFIANNVPNIPSQDIILENEIETYISMQKMQFEKGGYFKGKRFHKFTADYQEGMEIAIWNYKDFKEACNSEEQDKLIKWI